MAVQKTPRPLCYLNYGKSNAEEALTAFAEGSGAEITKRLKHVPGRPAVFYGVDRVTATLWHDVVRAREDYFYIDNGYFLGRAKGGPYMRITRGAIQHQGAAPTDRARWKALGLSFAPWRERGEHVLVACQSDWWHERHGQSLDDWVRWVKMLLLSRTKRPVVIRRKPIHGRKEPPLDVHLRNAHAVVVHSSMVGADALLAGVPVFTTFEHSAFLRVGNFMLDAIETPTMLEADKIEHWAGVLADNQWTFAEIRSGLAWRMLNGG